MAQLAAVGQKYLVTFHGSFLGQQIITTFWYRLEVLAAGGPLVSAIYTDIFNWFGAADGMKDKWVEATPGNYTLLETWAQCIRPNRYVKGIMTNGVSGEMPNSDASNISANIERHTDIATRRGTGGIRPPVSTHPDCIVLGSLTATQITKFNAIATLMLAQIGNGTTQNTLRPIIFNPSFIPDFEYVTYTAVKPFVRTMHRRTVGLGK